MSKIYIDTNDGFKCYASNITGALLEFDESYFDGKCAEFIEGYRCKPSGYTWVDENGEVFNGGKLITAWKPYHKLEKAQLEYELAQYKTQMAEATAAYESGVNSI